MGDEFGEVSRRKMGKTFLTFKCFVLNPKSNHKRKDTIRCELKNSHLSSNVYCVFEGRS